MFVILGIIRAQTTDYDGVGLQYTEDMWIAGILKDDADATKLLTNLESVAANINKLTPVVIREFEDTTDEQDVNDPETSTNFPKGPWHLPALTALHQELFTFDPKAVVPNYIDEPDYGAKYTMLNYVKMEGDLLK